MKNRVQKGMILAAGLGTRLRPLTFKTPKPLIEVEGKKLIEYGIELLKKNGINDIVVNLHHLGDQIETFLGDGSRFGVSIAYSKEKEILGTGGGIRKVLDHFGDDPFVVINSDLITDIDIRGVFRFHQEKGVLATLVLRPLEENETYTPIKVRDGHLIEFGSGELMYTGVQIVEPELLRNLPINKSSDIVLDVYVPILKREGRIAGYIHSGFWTEIGTLNSLKKAEKQFRRFINEEV